MGQQHKCNNFLWSVFTKESLFLHEKVSSASAPRGLRKKHVTHDSERTSFSEHIHRFPRGPMGWIFPPLVEQWISTGCVFQGWAGCFGAGNIVCSWKTEQQLSWRSRLPGLWGVNLCGSPRGRSTPGARQAMPGHEPRPALLPRPRSPGEQTKLFSSMRGSR